MLRKSVHESALFGYRICSSTPIISHLLFTYDIIIFYDADLNYASAIKDILHQYEIILLLAKRLILPKLMMWFLVRMLVMNGAMLYTLYLDPHEVLALYKYLGSLMWLVVP